ncbi:excalibur domain-containing protein [Mycobacterium sp. ACS4331]|nr:excalibur domain-containing protein [Mycobacterium sp. ACS4331]
MGVLTTVLIGVALSVGAGPLSAAETNEATWTRPPMSQQGECDSNYSGCVPVASDVDCAGGSGNGPEYVAGPISVIGDDIYELDRDGDGVACDNQ